MMTEQARFREAVRFGQLDRGLLEISWPNFVAYTWLLVRLTGWLSGYNE